MDFVIRVRRPSSRLGKKNPVGVTMFYTGGFLSRDVEESEVEATKNELRAIASDIACASLEEEWFEA